MRKAVLALVVLCVCSLFATPSEATTTRWVMGYYAIYARDRMPVAEIEWGGMTHIAVAAVVPRADGSLDTSFYWDASNGPAMAKDLAARATAHGVRPILMVGGAGTHDPFAAAVRTQPATLVGNLVTTMRDLGYAGLDIDFEPITTADEAPLASFISALRAAAPTALLTLPVNWVNANSPTASAFYGQVAPKLDRVNVMTYGMSGAWTGWKTWHSSALQGHTASTPSSVSSTVAAYRRVGVPAAKIGLGVGFFGQCWTGGVRAPQQSTTGAAVVGDDNSMSYTKIMSSYYSGTAYRYDYNAQAPYLTFTTPKGPNGCTYVSFEDKRSIAAKGAYARNNGLGGAIVWNINLGHDRNALAGQRDALLRSTRSAFGA